ncbi:MAG: ATP-binding protein, partial [Rhodobacteraceae bacterium]|nr:ATP-binding protein [Paracoccaceae bacterium]
MSALSPVLSEDQADAFDQVADMLAAAGVNITDNLLTPPRDGKQSTLAVTGKAGSGKTLLLAELTRALTEAGVDVVSGDYEGRKRKDRRTLA